MDTGVLYNKIFDTASNQMQKSDMQFSFSKTAYESILYRNPNEISVLEFMGLSPKDFIDSVYLRCLNRLPDPVGYKQLDAIQSDNKKDVDYWKYFVLLLISRSPEFENKNKKFIGLDKLKSELLRHGTLKTKSMLKKEEIKVGFKILIKKYCLLPVWRRLPEGIKNKLRRSIMKGNL